MFTRESAQRIANVVRQVERKPIDIRFNRQGKPAAPPSGIALLQSPASYGTSSPANNYLWHCWMYEYAYQAKSDGTMQRVATSPINGFNAAYAIEINGLYGQGYRGFHYVTLYGYLDDENQTPIYLFNANIGMAQPGTLRKKYEVGSGIIKLKVAKWANGYRPTEVDCEFYKVPGSDISHIEKLRLARLDPDNDAQFSNQFYFVYTAFSTDGSPDKGMIVGRCLTWYFSHPTAPPSYSPTKDYQAGVLRLAKTPDPSNPSEEVLRPAWELMNTLP